VGGPARHITAADPRRYRPTFQKEKEEEKTPFVDEIEIGPI
jgi:hypothetical protein